MIIVLDVTFLNQLDNLLKVTPDRTIANFIMWRVASASTDFMTKQLRKLQFEYYTVLNGEKCAEAPLEGMRWNC